MDPPSPSPLVRAVLRGLPDDVARAPGLPAALEALDARARVAWPGLAVDEAEWARWLAERVARLNGAGDVATLDGPGLYLACASAASTPAALEAFDRTLREASLPALARLGLGAAAVDEVLQRARAHLLVGEGAPARLNRFLGRGTLAAWLRTVVVHLAADERREQGRAADDLGEELLALPGGLDPELETVRADSRQHVRRAFHAAVAALEARERTLLRLHVVERLSIDRIAPVFGASRASVARWLNDARESLARDVRRRLAADLGLASGELDSLMTLVRSRIDLSIERVLRGAGD